MPVTPFHFGPAAALHALAPRHISFWAFCGANVLIDLESGYNLLRHQYPVHAFLHTYIGATLIAVLMPVLYLLLRRVAAWFDLPNLLGWKSLTLKAVALGAVLGAYSHVLLDSVMHADIMPLLPFSPHNALYQWVSLSVLHWFCLGAAFFAVCVMLIRHLCRAKRSDASIVIKSGR